MVIREKKRLLRGKGRKRDGRLQNKSGSHGGNLINSGKDEELKAQSHDMPVFGASGHSFLGLHSERKVQKIAGSDDRTS